VDALVAPAVLRIPAAAATPALREDDPALRAEAEMASLWIRLT
jgi:hypothetical protein